jgi:AhpD family alkylhydroperoxidase
MNSPRLPWTSLAPAQYKSMYAVSQSLVESPLGGKLIELVQTRVSQINGCAFCLDMHVRELRKSGEAWQRLNVLSAWRETEFFSAREQAALAWAETMTRLADSHTEREVEFQALRAHFSDAEIVELTWVIAAINAWNRMAIGMHQPVAADPID